MYGVGYPVLEPAVSGQYVIGMLVIQMVGKMVATGLTIGIGGSGGVFAPTLFIGAMASTALGTTVHHWWPALTESSGAYGMIGMGAATCAPITAVVILFELTGEYSIILPLMAAGTGRLLSKTTIYTAKLWSRGVDLGSDACGLPVFTAADIAGAAPHPQHVDAEIATAAAALSKSGIAVIPCVTTGGAAPNAAEVLTT